MKKFVSLMLILILALSLAACGEKEPDDPQPVEHTTHVHYFAIKLGDLGFNDAGYAGSEKGAAKYGWEYTFTELGDDTSTYESAFRDVLDEGGVDVVVTENGYGLGDLCQKYAPAYPDTVFIYFDASRDLDLSAFDNVYASAFETSQSCFLAGAMAGKLSKTGKVGAFIYNEIPGGFDFAAGYLAGLQYANPDAQLFLTYGDGTKGPDVLYEISNAMVEAGADIILGASGRAFSGLVQSLTEKGGVEAGLYAFGPDTDMYTSFAAGANAQYADVILTCVLKNIENSVLYALDCYHDGTLECGKVDVLGIDKGGAGISDNEHYRALIPAEIGEYVDQITEDIRTGKLHVKSYYEYDGVEDFKAWCESTGMIATY